MKRLKQNKEKLFEYQDFTRDEFEAGQGTLTNEEVENARLTMKFEVNKIFEQYS